MRKSLVANRGEIAVRVIRACRDMGIETGRRVLGLRSRRAARQARRQAVHIGGNAPGESYLRLDRIVHAARQTPPMACIPATGSWQRTRTSPPRARRGTDLHRPTTDAIALMGSKDRRAAGGDAGRCAVVPGTEEPLGADVPEVAIAADGGSHRLSRDDQSGRGRRRQGDAAGRRPPTNLSVRLAPRVRKRRAAFGDPAIYLERRITRPRHIEFSCSATAPARCCRSSSASVRFNGGIRR
jgi:acetyl/propionyl-CoA carboxylase alpha subunit